MQGSPLVRLAQRQVLSMRRCSRLAVWTGSRTIVVRRFEEVGGDGRNGDQDSQNSVEDEVCAHRARATEEESRVIARAAKLLNATVSSFVVEAAVEKAETVVARADHTMMPAAQFDEMIAALDDTTPIPELESLAALPRRITRR